MTDDRKARYESKRIAKAVSFNRDTEADLLAADNVERVKAEQAYYNNMLFI